MTEETTEKAISVFDFINDIGYDKNYIVNEDTISQYDTFIVSKAFGQSLDTVLLANEMNKRPNVSKFMHHDFLFFSVMAAKRYEKWAKKEKKEVDLVEYIKEKYALGDERALEYISLMSDDYIEELKNKMKQKGGKK